MTLFELLARVYDETGYETQPPPTIAARMTQFLNDGVRRVLSEPGMGRLADSDDPYAFASVASQARYVVPESVQAIKVVSDRTNLFTLDAMSLASYRGVEPNPATYTGVPTRFVPIGKVAVAVQPSAADVLLVKSTSASDNATVTAYIQGLRTGGYLATDAIAMNGTTAAQFAAFSDWIEVTGFYLSANAIGTVTLLQTSGSGTVLATVSVGHKRPRYYGFYLWPTPSGAYSYDLDYRREYEPMANPMDEPPWPTDFHPLLVDYAAWRELSAKADARKADAFGRYTDWVKRLKFDTQWAATETPVMGSRRSKLSRLGGQFPADTVIGR